MTDFLIPDKVGEPRVAWRSWKLHAENEDLWLQSISQGDSFWYPREIKTAECNLVTDSSHGENESPPVEGCKCGIYALNSNIDLVGITYASNVGPGRELFVWGEINLWGKIIEGQHGIKAQHAYPKHLYLRGDVHRAYPFAWNKLDSYAIKDLMKEAWGVPVDIGETISRRSLEDQIARIDPPASDKV